MFDKNQATRLLPDDLPAKFAAYAATGTGDQHHPVRQIAREQGPVGGHRLPAQQVFGVEFLEILNGNLTRGQVDHGWQGSHMNGQASELRDDPVALLPLQRRHGQQNVSNTQAFHRIGHII